MRAELGNLNHCAVPFLSCTDANLCWYYYITDTDINNFSDNVMVLDVQFTSMTRSEIRQIVTYNKNNLLGKFHKHCVKNIQQRTAILNTINGE